MGLYKCIMACIHCCSLIESSFTALKILCALSIRPSCTPSPGESIDLLTSEGRYPQISTDVVSPLFSVGLFQLSSRHMSYLKSHLLPIVLIHCCHQKSLIDQSTVLYKVSMMEDSEHSNCNRVG